MIHHLNWFSVTCDEPDCPASIEVSASYLYPDPPNTQQIVAEKLRASHWFMDPTEQSMPKTSTFCPYHGPDLKAESCSGCGAIVDSPHSVGCLVWAAQREGKS